MKIKLFGNTIEPACLYCEFGSYNRKTQTVQCRRHGEVPPHSSCRSYRYAPLKRIPRRAADLPQYSQKDFEL